MSDSRVDQRRNSRFSLPAALLLISAGWLFATLSHASVKGKWSDDVSRDMTFSRVLVVGISPDRNQRCRFERTMASMIRSSDTVALVSCEVIPAETPLTRESIEAALAAENADAVLTTSLISRSWESQEGGSIDTIGSAAYKATDVFFGAYGTVVAVDFQVIEPITTLRGKAELTSKLYEAQSANVVYTMESKVRNIDSISEGLVAIAGPIGEKLRKAGLIR